MGLGRSYLDYIEECVDDALGDLAGKLAAEFWLSAITPWATIEAPSLCPKHPQGLCSSGHVAREGVMGVREGTQMACTGRTCPLRTKLVL